jgi:glycosyltransferase involved in cell wall biosynthesis
MGHLLHIAGGMHDHNGAMRPSVGDDGRSTALIVGRALHAPWNEGTRVINRNFAQAARTLRPVRVVSLTNVSFRADRNADPAHDLAIQHVYSRGGYGLKGVFAGLPAVVQQLSVSGRERRIGVAHLFGLPLSLAPWLQNHRIRVVDHLMVRPLQLRDRALVRGSVGVWGRWVDAFAVSSHTLIPLLRAWRIPDSKLFVLPSAVDASVFRPGDRDAARKQLGLSLDQHLIIYIGRLSARRFPARIVREALQIAGLSTSRQLHFVCVTPGQTFDGSANSASYLMQCAQVVAEDLRNIPNVSVEVRMQNLEDPDKLAWLRAADAVLLPFVAPEAVEPPITLLEAMACGATIVTSPAANRSELIRSGVNGYVYHSADEFARLLSNVVSDIGSQPPLGEAARRTVLAHHSFQAVAEATARLWQQVESQPNHTQA